MFILFRLVQVALVRRIFYIHWHKCVTNNYEQFMCAMIQTVWICWAHISRFVLTLFAVLSLIKISIDSTKRVHGEFLSLLRRMHSRFARKLIQRVNPLVFNESNEFSVVQLLQIIDDVIQNCNGAFYIIFWAF